MPLGLHWIRKFESFPLHFICGEEISIILSPNSRNAARSWILDFRIWIDYLINDQSKIQNPQSKIENGRMRQMTTFLLDRKACHFDFCRPSTAPYCDECGRNYMARTRWSLVRIQPNRKICSSVR